MCHTCYTNKNNFVGSCPTWIYNLFACLQVVLEFALLQSLFILTELEQLTRLIVLKCHKL